MNRAPIGMCSLVTAAAAALLCGHEAAGQITSNDGDGVLNAPYRGTINSLRECSADVAYGEVMTHMEPNDPADATRNVTGSEIRIWSLDPWDRSILRLYDGLDASGGEIDLTSTVQMPVDENNPFSAPKSSIDGVSKGQFSFKAIGIKTLVPQTFNIRLSYELDSIPEEQTVTITVAPITGSFCALSGESEGFLYGTPLLDVSVGNARLAVPAGQTADMIGATFTVFNDDLAGVAVDRANVLLPGSAETVFLQEDDQFRKVSTSSIDQNNWSRKQLNEWGTPWPGYLRGYRSRGDRIYTPGGTFFDPPNISASFRRFESIHPLGEENHTSSQFITYDNSANNRVIEIRDNVDSGPPSNNITLTRDAMSGFVECIETSDGRSWKISADAVTGWITGIEPGNCTMPTGKGARFFSRNSAGRITEVRDATDVVMYFFDFADDAHELQMEQRFIDAPGGGALQNAVEHTSIGNTLIRKEFTSSGQFRQMDFDYDIAGNLAHRLTDITTYDGLNAAAPTFVTSFTHDINNRDGTMYVTEVTLPNGARLIHNYDPPAISPAGNQDVEFGLRSTTIHSDSGGSNSITLINQEYELFYGSSSIPRIARLPRIIKTRDGRHPSLNTETVLDFVDDGNSTIGPQRNQVQFRNDPVVNLGPSSPRTPRTEFTYDLDENLDRQIVDYAPGLSRVTEFTHDGLRRRTSETLDPDGASPITMRFLYCDASATQDRITIDPDGYITRTQFDNDGRPTIVQRFLDAQPAFSSACGTPTGLFYQTQNIYNTNGRLFQQLVDNKDQTGAVLTPPITTQFEYDRLGRLTKQTVDPGGIGQVTSFTYNWQGDVITQTDTSGRGTEFQYDGRGLVKQETPIDKMGALITGLRTTFDYDENGNLEFTTDFATGAQEERIYDGFDRVEKVKRNPGSDGGNVIITTFTYDDASNVERTVVDEEVVGVLADTTAKFDEGRFNYESRQRTTTGIDSADDVITEREFDWAGNLTVERTFGDATVVDRVITTVYDDANRIDMILDSEGGQTAFMRDDRGNVVDQIVKLDAIDSATTTTEYDALSRAITITEPEDQNGLRADRVRQFDSRGNLLRESLRDASDVAQLTTVFAYDNAGRQTRRAVLDNPLSTVDAGAAVVTADRVVDTFHDADGRVEFRHTYNNNLATVHETATTYDTLGRIDTVTDPSDSFTDDDYGADGRRSQRTVFDGVGSRTITFAYDGHNRVTSQTRLGTPNLTTSFELDGLDRQVATTDPRNIVTRIAYDLLGRRIALVEDEGGPLDRRTEFDYNPLGQLVEMRAQNTANDGTFLGDQTTEFRYDSLGRQLRMMLGDSMDTDIANCTDCIVMEYDLAGRTTRRTDQRNITTTMQYDDRGLTTLRLTGVLQDSFTYDALGRLVLGERGITADPDSLSSIEMDYTGLGDLEFEKQTIQGGAQHTVNYFHDQGGNRIQTDYPSGESLAFAPTEINQVDSINLNSLNLVDYQYQGRLLGTRAVSTDDPSGNKSYEYSVGYDSHRRISGVTNRFVDGATAQTLADYQFTYDDAGNPLSQIVQEGTPDFAADDRLFEVDRLNRLTKTTHFESATTEETTLDRLGNRELHVDRTGETRDYGAVNDANEYASIIGTALSYDAAGNLLIDEAGRQYSYDERSRLKEVRDAGGGLLASYAYDALGRRIIASVDGVTTHYLYDGQNIIEERDDQGARKRFHVNGSQFVDERVATFDDASSAFDYYLPNRNFTIAGTGNADGTVIERTDIDSMGSFERPPSGFFFDADGDGDIDQPDLEDALNCQTPPNVPAAPGCEIHDFDGDGDVDMDDIDVSADCMSGDGNTPPNFCLRSATFYHDANGDRDVDLEDFTEFSFCLEHSQFDPWCVAHFDFSTGDVAPTFDGRVFGSDFAAFQDCFAESATTVPPGGPVTPDTCLRSSGLVGFLPQTGSFSLHGRPVDVLPDGKILTYVRARYYDASNGRWLQRDPSGFIDGANLFQAFSSNPLTRGDPAGTDDVILEGNNLVYQGDIMRWEFARGIGGGLVLIEHPEWPYAFIMRRNDAWWEFDQYIWEKEWTHPLQIMQRLTGEAREPASAVVAILDKSATPPEWTVPKEFGDSEQLEKVLHIQRDDLAAQIENATTLTAASFQITTGLLVAPAGIGGLFVEVGDVGSRVISSASAGNLSVPDAAFITVAALGASLHLKVGFADDVLRGGAAPVRKGVAAEQRVSGAIGIPRNVGPGRVTIESLTGTAKFRVPDFGPEATIALRGSIVEVKNVTRLQITPQIRDLIADVERLRMAGLPDLVLEIFTNGRIPASGQIARLQERGLLRITPIP